MSCSFRRGLACLLLFFVIFPAPAAAQVRRVVLLYDERTELPGLAILDARLVRTLRAGAPGVEVYPEASVVFCGIDRRDVGARPLPANVTGVLLKREFAPTLELALRLHPGTQDVVVVAGGSDFDHRLVDQAKA